MVQGRTHRPIIDVLKCGSCLVCVKGCPAEICLEMRKEDSSLRGYVYKGLLRETSIDSIKVSMPPCQLACPIKQDIRSYLILISQKRFKEAIGIIRETNALPSVCGHVCHHPCEENCIRGIVDDSMSIRGVKRFVADLSSFSDQEVVPLNDHRRKEKRVSIIGAGPAGLTAAYNLSRIGYQVEIIEALPEPGGMLRWAVPPFRLPRDVLNRDIKYIEKMGVAIRTNIKFGIDITLSGLKREGTDAIVMAIGTHKDLEIGIKGQDHIEGYFGCLDFLKKYAFGEHVDIGDRVIVVGGGNAAIDTARSALRNGGKEVRILYRRGCEEMPADKSEVTEAKIEGVRIDYFVQPTKIIGKDGKVDGLECINTELGEADETGRRRPLPQKGSEFIVNATSIIMAVGQEPDFTGNKQNLPFDFSPMNTFVINDGYMTNLEGVFAVGDCVNGPTTVVEAMASGKEAAKFVDLYLSNK